MTLVQYQTANNAIGTLKTAITSMAAQFVMNTDEGDLFPDPASGQYWLCMEQWNVSGQVTKRELRLVTAKTDDTFTANRAADSVPIAYDSLAQTTTAMSFDPVDGPVTIRMTTPKAYFKNIIDELVRIESAKLNLTGGSLTGQLKEAKATNTASATTVDLGALAGNLVHITGTTTISSFGTAQAGTEVTVIFDGILSLIHNATSMILPNAGSNITTAAGDRFTFRSEGSGNWICVAYARANGTALQSTAIPTATTSTAGISELATDAETAAKSATDRVITASNLAIIAAPNQKFYNSTLLALPTSFQIAHGLSAAPTKIRVTTWVDKGGGQPTSVGDYKSGNYSTIYKVYASGAPPAFSSLATNTSNLAQFDWISTSNSDDQNVAVTISSIDATNINFTVTRTIGGATTGNIYFAVEFEI